jgi:hypothetical protein
MRYAHPPLSKVQRQGPRCFKILAFCEYYPAAEDTVLSIVAEGEEL